MPEQTVTLESIHPRRGRGPATLAFAGGLELSTFDQTVVKQAAAWLLKAITVKWDEKSGKNGQTYRNIVSLALADGAGEAPESISQPSGATISVPAIPTQRVGLDRASKPPVGPIQELEQHFALAVRQRELLEDFVRHRFKDEVHFMSGEVFGSDKPVLLQPGAQLILYCHGFSVDFEPLTDLPQSPSDQTAPYTVAIKALVRNRDGRVVGTAIGSAGSHIWSGRQSRYVLRGPDPEKAMNSTLKIAQKRALVSACNNCTASSEFFTTDLDDAIDSK